MKKVLNNKTTVMMILIMLIVIAGLFMGCSQLGKNPTNQRMERIKNSPNYKDGSFHNLVETPVMTTENSRFSSLWDFFFKKNEHSSPSIRIPSSKVDLKQLSPSENTLVWFGHSSYFFQLGGKTYLVDPVFSGHASPLPFMIKSFEGSDVYTADDMPDIDYLIITHDHYDHLDYDTIKKLKGRIKKVVCGLGVGEHFEYWGFEKDRIWEGDWNDEIRIDENTILTVLPARHFSGRNLKSNQTLWASFALKTSSLNLFLGGDGGYGSHFKVIGEKHGPFDFVILENGQYNSDWRYIHMAPEETYRAALDLNAKRLLAVHSSKFILSRHSWDEPLESLSKLDTESQLLLTPRIGEKVDLNDQKQKFFKWWKLGKV